MSEISIISEESGPHDQELLKDFRKFQDAMRSTVQELQKRGFKDEDDWRIKFYNSFDAFSDGYADTAERKEAIRYLQSINGILDQVMTQMKPICTLDVVDAA